MRFKVFGTEIYVSFLFTAVIALMLAVDKTGYMIPALFAVFMHEMGHLFAMWVLECNPKQVRLIPASVQIVRGLESKQGSEIIIATCGPLTNIIIFLTLYINYLSFDNEMVLNFALLNLIIGLFNLLPVSGLDGGTILLNLLSLKLELNKSLIIVRFITYIVAAFILVTAVFLLIDGTFNVSLFIIGIYLVVMNLIKM